MAPDGLTTDLGTLRLRTPLIAASGTVGSVWEWADVADVRVYGAAVAKSVAPVEWPGRPAPRLAGTGSGMLNGIGIQNPGIVGWVETMRPKLGNLDVPVWGSAVGSSPEEFALVAKGLVTAGIEVVEVNLSCPNLEDGRMFALDADRSREVVEAVVASGEVLVGAKLSPNAEQIIAVAEACVAGGASFLTLTNTALGFGISLEDRRPLLSGGVGGYSGPGLKPLSLRCVYEVATAIPRVPIVGCGGVTTGRDVVEYLLAGASAVGVGTVHFSEPRAGARIRRELVGEMRRLEVQSVSELVGAVRPW
ncbi:MAG TPA: dihydroorotate dehydrogenase [Acidimicrobiia bacterium]|nr:dihydroorotate dehydrogenase [Acidimicrobiia bacterium]